MRLHRRFVRTLALLALLALGPAAAPAAAADACSHRGKLDALYCDEDRDGLADLPKDKAKILSPDPLVFAYVPVEDPAEYAPTFAVRSGRLHITGYSTGAVNLSGAIPFAQMATAKGPSGYQLVAIARGDGAKINALADLKGKRVAHVSQTSRSTPRSSASSARGSARSSA